MLIFDFSHSSDMHILNEWAVFSDIMGQSQMYFLKIEYIMKKNAWTMYVYAVCPSEHVYTIVN